MATSTEMVAAVVVHSSAAAFSHFGVTIDGPQLQPRPAAPAEQRVVARSPRKGERTEKVMKTAICPDRARAQLQKA